MNLVDKVREAARWSLRLSSGEVGERAVQGWLDADVDNRRAYEELNATLEGVDRFAGAPEMVNLRGEALVLARRSHDVVRAKSFFASKLGIAASVVFLVLATGLVGIGLRVYSQNFATGVGERRTFALADGSQLSLDAATHVKVNYSAERRRLVLESGRAKFDVAKDPLRPFTVEAGGKVVVATGTSFSVELLTTQLHVVLYEGHVEVLDLGAARPERSSQWVLSPGQELIASGPRPNAPARVAAIEPARTLSWESGDLAFTEEPLALAVGRVNRYSKEKVIVADASAADVRISGVFHAGDTEAFVDGVSSLFPIRAERDDDGVKLFFRERTRR